MNVTQLPFNRLLGLELGADDNSSLVCLPDGPQYTNHLGTVHASALLAVAEAVLPGVAPSPPLFVPAQLNNRLWHLAFNRLEEVNEQLVKGREDIYFGWQFATKAARKLPGYAVRYYVHTLASIPGALRGSFGWYRALDTTLASLGVDRRDLLHAAQSLFHDHVPAKREGLSSIWINRRHDRPGWGATPEPTGEWSYDQEFNSMTEFADAVDEAFTGS